MLLNIAIHITAITLKVYVYVHKYTVYRQRIMYFPNRTFFIIKYKSREICHQILKTWFYMYIMENVCCAVEYFIVYYMAGGMDDKIIGNNTHTGDFLRFHWFCWVWGIKINISMWISLFFLFLFWHLEVVYGGFYGCKRYVYCLRTSSDSKEVPKFGFFFSFSIWKPSPHGFQLV